MHIRSSMTMVPLLAMILVSPVVQAIGELRDRFRQRHRSSIRLQCGYRSALVFRANIPGQVVRGYGRSSISLFRRKFCGTGNDHNR